MPAARRRMRSGGRDGEHGDRAALDHGREGLRDQRGEVRHPARARVAGAEHRQRLHRGVAIAFVEVLALVDAVIVGVRQSGQESRQHDQRHERAGEQGPQHRRRR
jgi:hypothetical protein